MDDRLLVNVALPMANLIIMLAVGLVLCAEDFRRVVVAPRPVVFGLLAHYVLLPTLGFAAAWLCRGQPAVAIGFVLVAACPSASVSNLLTHLAGGNVGLAVTLTAISALATLVSIPLWVHVASGWFGGDVAGIALPIGATIARLLALVLAPLAVGMLIRHYAPSAALRLQPLLGRVGLLALLGTVVLYIATNAGLFFGAVARVGAISLAMSALAIASGLLLGRAARLEDRDTVTLGMESGVQNCMLAMLVSLTLVGSVEMALPAMTYGVAMFIPALIFVRMARQRRKEPRMATP